MTAGELVSFLLLAITVAAAVGALVSLFGRYQEAVGAAQRVFELLDMQPTVRSPRTRSRCAAPCAGPSRSSTWRSATHPSCPTC
jgi:ABC-type multidrug transport system fused ATPase/permease subunit